MQCAPGTAHPRPRHTPKKLHHTFAKKLSSSSRERGSYKQWSEVSRGSSGSSLPRSFHLREHDTIALEPCLDMGIVEGGAGRDPDAARDALGVDDALPLDHRLVWGGRRRRRRRRRRRWRRRRRRGRGSRWRGGRWRQRGARAKALINGAPDSALIRNRAARTGVEAYVIHDRRVSS